MTLILKIKQSGTSSVIFKKLDLYLNELRKNPAANLDRSPLIHRHGYASVGDRSTLFARFPLSLVPFTQYAGITL